LGSFCQLENKGKKKKEGAPEGGKRVKKKKGMLTPKRERGGKTLHPVSDSREVGGFCLKGSQKVEVRRKVAKQKRPAKATANSEGLEGGTKSPFIAIFSNFTKRRKSKKQEK